MIKKHSLFYYSLELKQCIEITAGLLTDSHLEAFPVRYIRPVAKRCFKMLSELHSSGTVRDSHPIPF